MRQSVLAGGTEALHRGGHGLKDEVGLVGILEDVQEDRHHLLGLDVDQGQGVSHGLADAGVGIALHGLDQHGMADLT